MSAIHASEGPKQKNALKLAAFDLGAESGRAMLGEFDGEKIRLSEVHRFPNVPSPLPDGLHWDALALWAEVRKGLALCVKAAGGHLDGLGVDTWGVDFGLLDKHGVLIGNPFHYRDGRTDGIMERTYQRVPKAEIYDQTGIQFMQFNTLFQLYAMTLQNAPQLQIADRLLLMPDLINYWLAGAKGCEFTNATTTQCYDPRRRAWAKPLLERLGIPERIFPEIVPPGTVLGPLRAAVAEECGAQGLQVIAPACHDTGAAVAAVPASSAPSGQDFAWISSGTWSIMGVETPEAVINEGSLAFGLTNEGGVGGVYRLSKNIMGLWLVQESRRAWERQGQSYSYDALTRMAAEARPLRSVIDPDDALFFKPGDMPARIREYCRQHAQPEPETPGEIARTALEGVALKYRHVLQELEKLSGKTLTTLHIVGGGTQNRLLSQLAADATGRVVVTGPVEATALGNLLVQMMALGAVASLAEGREVIARSVETLTFEPDSSKCAQWDEAYAKMQAL